MPTPFWEAAKDSHHSPPNTLTNSWINQSTSVHRTRTSRSDKVGYRLIYPDAGTRRQSLDVWINWDHASLSMITSAGLLLNATGIQKDIKTWWPHDVYYSLGESLLLPSQLSCQRNYRTRIRIRLRIAAICIHVSSATNMHDEEKQLNLTRRYDVSFLSEKEFAEHRLVPSPNTTGPTRVLKIAMALINTIAVRAYQPHSLAIITPNHLKRTSSSVNITC